MKDLKIFEVSYSSHELFHIRIQAQTADEAREMVESGNFNPDRAVCIESELAHVNKVEEISL